MTKPPSDSSMLGTISFELGFVNLFCFLTGSELFKKEKQGDGFSALLPKGKYKAEEPSPCFLLLFVKRVKVLCCGGGGGGAFSVGEDAAEDSACQEYRVCYCPPVDHCHSEAHVLYDEEECDSHGCRSR